MISESEFSEWRGSKVTQAILEALVLGKETAQEELMYMRGEVGDFPRGAASAYEEVIHIFKTGEHLNFIEE